MTIISKSYTRKMLSSLALISVLGTTVLAGCSSDKSANNAASNNSEKNSASTSGSNFHADGMPIVDKPVTLDVLTIRWGNMGDTFTKNTWLQELEKNSNVKINWQVISSSDWDAQKSVMLASGKMPDVIIGNLAFGDSDIVNNLSIFRPLDDYIDKYMPNLKAAMEETPELKKLSTFPDGKIYSLPARLPSRPYSSVQPVINREWLDKLGLKAPETLDELYNVLKAFKEKDPNGNGKADEIPYSDSKDVDINLLAPFGITDIRANHMVIKDGKPEYFPTSEAYKAGIAWANKLYSEGLIDQETFTQDDTMLTAKRQNPDAALIGFSYQWTPDAVFGQWSKQYETIAPITGTDGKKYQVGEPSGMSFRRNEVLITTSNEHPEVTARWADQFYTGEASIQNFWGAIGTSIEKNSDGTYTLMDPPDGTSADAWYWDSSLRDFGPKYASPEFEKNIKLDPTSGDGLKLQLDSLGKDYVTQPFPDVMYTIEEYAELPTLLTDIESYIKSTRAKWVTKGGIDQEWDGYVKKLNDMGLAKLIKIYEDAYNRYMNIE
ncbi:putative aldouronate transport system substrate-binding protein [Paenibacillus catalpae]|uniref:Putative aldouronate transport system substrate-binding protein n=1 Tax=Paenibacillus catalpae TaxID=1045775 RepID=A0A1I1WNF8_9BACL|nr:extracellular solute-binding protein [Paenibacillus catalpae]SFD96717.1 putative aldouronate transport system substrate-binding protein [Paenibacillus catalpae]